MIYAAGKKEQNNLYFLALVTNQNVALSSATHLITGKLGLKWGTYCLNARFPLPTQPYAVYSVKSRLLNTLDLIKIIQNTLFLLLPGGPDVPALDSAPPGGVNSGASSPATPSTPVHDDNSRELPYHFISNLYAAQKYCYIIEKLYKIFT